MPASKPRKPKSKAQRLKELIERNQELSPEEALDPAREYALRLLDQRDYPSAQIRNKLLGRGYHPEAVEEVVTRLTDAKLLDDARYAQMLARTQHQMRGLARRAIAQEMRRKGLSAAESAEALEQITDESEAQAAEKLALKKAATTVRLPNEVRRRRIASMLARRGYNASVAYRATAAALAEYPSQTDDSNHSSDETDHFWSAD
ncbi:hypothetical protein BSR29_03620 [Boudabousia liubingyangii]|uniref:Regulatory protein RecX n=1 Tax=Boudabousia liubingyangii TaxID=1921764 RepID=A0A1Q5PNB5_9ACTO|nr:regulatory protein RecX [Boudabousia liubingyangii]OKL48940.1 hypothetical protein BSR29_03620 [Boudabousia liubingyangii]